MDGETAIPDTHGRLPTKVYAIKVRGLGRNGKTATQIITSTDRDYILSLARMAHGWHANSLDETLKKKPEILQADLNWEPLDVSALPASMNKIKELYG